MKKFVKYCSLLGLLGASSLALANGAPAYNQPIPVNVTGYSNGSVTLNWVPHTATGQLNSSKCSGATCYVTLNGKKYNAVYNGSLQFSLNAGTPALNTQCVLNLSWKLYKFLNDNPLLNITSAHLSNCTGISPGVRVEGNPNATAINLDLSY